MEMKKITEWEHFLFKMPSLFSVLPESLQGTSVIDFFFRGIQQTSDISNILKLFCCVTLPK